jgi:hypothetical protein
MAKKDKDTNFNYAAPGARVGLQAKSVVITGGIRFGGKDGDIQIGGISVADEDDED